MFVCSDTDYCENETAIAAPRTRLRMSEARMH